VFTATDAAGINRTTIKVNNVLLPDANWDTHGTPNGTATIRIDAWDNATPTQNTSFITRTVTVNNPVPPPADVTPPTITFTSPASGATVAGIVPILFTATDASGINRTEIRVDGVLQSTANWDSTTSANGTVSLRVDAWDNASPENTAFVTRSVTVANPVPPPPDPADVTPPTVTITEPTHLSTVSGIVPIHFTAADDVVVARTEVRVNGALLPSANWDTTGLVNGDYTIRVDVFDAADPTPNSDFEEITVTVDNPVVPPPDPPTSTETPRAIFVGLGTRDRVQYVLWSEVPAGQEPEHARPGYVSAWPKASAAEVAQVEAGVTAEEFGYMNRGDRTQEELQAELLILWARFNAAIQGTDGWNLTDTFWTGSAWVKR